MSYTYKYVVQIIGWTSSWCGLRSITILRPHKEVMLLILALGRQRQVDLCKFKASLVGIEFQGSSRYIVRFCSKKKRRNQ